MHYQQLFKGIIPFIILLSVFSSCTKEPIIIDKKDIISEQNELASPVKELLTMEMEDKEDAERKLCFDLEYPVELLFADKSKQSINSLEELLSAIENWYKENREKEGAEPTLNYPVKATLKDGTVKEIKDNEAFAYLMKSCFEDDEKEKANCFEIEYPVTIVFEDKTKQLIESEATLKEVLSDRNKEKYTYEFPISVTFKDKTFEIKSEEEFEELKKRCKAQDEDKDKDEHWGLFNNDCFELVYPVTLNLSDGTSRSVDSEEAILDIVNTERQKYNFAFPLTIQLEDGSTKEITDKQSFTELNKSCYDDKDDWEDDDRNHDWDEHVWDEDWSRQFVDFLSKSKCIEVDYPLTLIVSLGEENRRQVNSFEELIEAIRSNDREDFSLAFPINITVEGGQRVIEHEDALKQIVKYCFKYGEWEDKDEDHDFGDHDFDKDWSRQFIGLFSESTCFEVNYPLTIIVREENRQQVNNFEELIESIRSNDREGFSLEFPINITLDGEQKAIENEEALAEIVKYCLKDWEWEDEDEDHEFDEHHDFDEDFRFLEDCFTISYPISVVFDSEERRTIEISNNEEMIEIFETIVNDLFRNPGEPSVDFTYPFEITLVEENQQIELTSGVDFLKLLKHCW